MGRGAMLARRTENRMLRLQATGGWPRERLPVDVGDERFVLGLDRRAFARDQPSPQRRQRVAVPDVGELGGVPEIVALAVRAETLGVDREHRRPALAHGGDEFLDLPEKIRVVVT